jgi:hypothetical protein
MLLSVNSISRPQNIEDRLYQLYYKEKRKAIFINHKSIYEKKSISLNST